ncbi:uncharacterized protein PV09_06099 [Verruconis gallopava]|uniref:Thioesterase domain-containing protein n=1 Tax=Verruconis gallopava TaxID=253628 RepID=A0A0D1YPW5_9PEZI|nr:uncharacterized protein PV09_06099 [Verruconis gallopava]KIW02662.1 hypothetical protein PV09_06099 [Verruconis gallopava]
MPFFPLKTLRAKMSSVKDANGEETPIDWNDPYQRVKFFYEYNSPEADKCIDSLWRPHLKLVSVTVDAKDPTLCKTVFAFTVPPILSNAGGNLHGGAVAVIFDVCTSMTVAAAARDGFWDSGHVSRSLNCQYLRPVPTGGKVLIESEVVAMGKMLGQVRAEMRREEDGKVCYTCVHDKVQLGNREKL